MSTLSSELREFLQSWLQWAELGAPNVRIFDRTKGLCYCTMSWEERYDVDIIAELDDLFLDERYPFGMKEYADASKDGTMHLDVNRLTWVRKQLCVK